PNQMTVRGESFDSFDLDDFVSDADHPDSVINWAATGETNFTVSINSENVVTIQVNDTNFVGSDTVTFTATDPDGFSDSDEAIFAVQPPQVTFTQIQQNIFNQSCAFSGCHDGGSNQLPGVMDLREGMAFQSIVNVQSIEIPQLNRVEPGQPDSSYIVWKIEGRQGIQGQRMPLGGSPLSQEKINMMRDWILNGAPNN
ncbi:MAG: hypothetical protein GWN13_23845, partial [Phycisphaerae bacterium]|nr:hypothetical protein [Phycisphaerae bacterium]